MSEEKIVQANTKKLQVATFAAGCFWGVGDAFSKVNGVKSTTVGYTGGSFDNHTQVCDALTAEQYEICRRKGTEPPFSEKYVNSKEKGIYMCVCCGKFHRFKI
jgi:hypothetical protein